MSQMAQERIEEEFDDEQLKVVSLATVIPRILGGRMAGQGTPLTRDNTEDARSRRERKLLWECDETVVTCE